MDAKTTGGDTALHWACSAEGSDGNDPGENFEECSLRVAELLIGAGAAVRARNNRGEKPSDLASGGAIGALLLSASQELEKREEAEVRTTLITLIKTRTAALTQKQYQ